MWDFKYYCFCFSLRRRARVTVFCFWWTWQDQKRWPKQAPQETGKTKVIKLYSSRQKTKIFPPELKIGSINRRQVVKPIAYPFASYLLCGHPTNQKRVHICAYSVPRWFKNLKTMSSTRIQNRLRLKWGLFSKIRAPTTFRYHFLKFAQCCYISMTLGMVNKLSIENIIVLHTLHRNITRLAVKTGKTTIKNDSLKAWKETGNEPK